MLPRNETILSPTMKNEKRFRKGPRTFANGCTHASVSEIVKEEDIVDMAVSIEVKSVFVIILVVSIMFNPLADVVFPMATRGTGAKAAAVDIVAMAQRSWILYMLR